MGKGRLLYADIWTKLAPLSAGFYWLIASVFGKSYLALRLAAILLVTLQAFLMNRIFIRNNIYNEKNYLPALLYVVFMNLSTDFMTLSPQLISLSFLILSLDYLLKSEIKKNKSSFLWVGIYTGLSFLSYAPAILFLLSGFLILLLFGMASWRDLLMYAYGFLLLLSVFLTYFFLRDSFHPFWQQYIQSVFDGKYLEIGQATSRELILQLALPALILLFGMLATFKQKRFVNHQVSCQQIMIFWIVAAASVIILVEQYNPAQFIYMTVPMSFFVTHHLLSIRKKYLANLYLYVLLLLFFISGIANLYADKSFYPIAVEKFWADLPKTKKYQNKRLLVLGNQHEYYLHNQLATPYLNWQLAEKIHFTKTDRYAVLQAIYQSFSADLPEVIIDQKGLLTNVFYHIPELGEQYRKQGENIYLLQKNYKK